MPIPNLARSCDHANRWCPVLVLYTYRLDCEIWRIKGEGFYSLVTTLLGGQADWRVDQGGSEFVLVQTDPATVERLIREAEGLPGASAHASLPCTVWSV